MFRSELERFVMEDLGWCDDSSAIIPDIDARAVIIAKDACVLSGLSEAAELLDYFGLQHVKLASDGDFLDRGRRVIEISGKARCILQAERLVLNFLGRMSGISTLTRECVSRAGGVRVACTRKTTPGFRAFEKKAVVLGGGDPHRFNLSGAVLIKDNHLELMGIEECIAAARRQASFTKKIEVEVEDLDQLMEAAKHGADIIMFDNMDPADIEKGVKLIEELGIRSNLILEASGGITPENIGKYASSGVDVISVGALTRSAVWADFSLEIEQYL